MLQPTNAAEQLFCCGIVAEVLPSAEILQMLAEVVQGLLHMIEALSGDILELQRRNDLAETASHPVGTDLQATGPMTGFKESLEKRGENLACLADLAAGNPRTATRSLEGQNESKKQMADHHCNCAGCHHTYHWRTDGAFTGHNR